MVTQKVTSSHGEGIRIKAHQSVSFPSQRLSLLITRLICTILSESKATTQSEHAWVVRGEQPTIREPSASRI